VVPGFPGVGAETANEGAGEGGDKTFADFVADEAACYGACAVEMGLVVGRGIGWEW